MVSTKYFSSLYRIVTAAKETATLTTVILYKQTYKMRDIAGAVYHLVIYMQSKKIHKVF